MSPNDLSMPAPGRDLRLPFGIALVAAACLAPLFLGNYALHAIIIALIFLLPAHGLNLLVGYTGLLSLAQAAFFGIGKNSQRRINSLLSYQSYQWCCLQSFCLRYMTPELLPSV